MKKIIRNLALIITVAVVAIACSSPKPEKTIKNLEKAIAEETLANAGYVSFSSQASEEGHQNINKMFSAIATAKAIHINNYQSILTKLGVKVEPVAKSVTIGNTTENIQVGIDNETHKSTFLYPEFLEIAELEKSKDAVKSFMQALDTEKKYIKLFTDALNTLTTTGNDATISETWHICPKCGDIYASIDRITSCETCGTASSTFNKM